MNVVKVPAIDLANTTNLIVTRATRSNTVRILNSLALLSVIVSAQFIVLTHTHDSLGQADAVCKVCVSGEHFGHALLDSGNRELPAANEFLLASFIPQAYTALLFTTALARAPPSAF